MTQVMQLSPPTQSKGKPERLSGGVYNWGCNTIPHVVLFTTLDCYLPILSTISSFLPPPSYDTFSLSLKDSSICHKLGIPFHESMVPTSLLVSQINLESLRAFMGHLEMEHCWFIIFFVASTECSTSLVNCVGLFPIGPTPTEAGAAC